MATISTVLNGLNFFASKQKDGDDLMAVSAEHDVLYCTGPRPEELTPEEVQNLVDWGWRWDKELDCCWRKFT
jgi:hypothetical protein